MAKRPIGNCQECGSTLVFRSWIRGNVRETFDTRRKYCDHSCAAKATAERRNLSRIRNWLRYNEGAYSAVNDRKCLTCQTLFTESRKQGSRFYCSTECFIKDKAARAKESLMRNMGVFTRGLKVCPETGYLFHPNRMHQVYATREISVRVGRRVERAKRRAITRGTDSESIDPIAVFHMQKWMCQLCGERTDPSLRGTWAANAPELDHIIPLSAGGRHTLDNVQTACRTCNADKGAKAPGGAIEITGKGRRLPAPTQTYPQAS